MAQRKHSTKSGKLVEFKQQMERQESATLSRNNSWFSVRSRKFSSTSGKYPSPRSKSARPQSRKSLPLTVFDRIKIETERTISHGHPLILQTPYGKFGHVFDIIALFHNAVKKDILASYNVLETMLRLKYEVTHAQTDMFFDWFHTFQRIFRLFLDVEKKFIYPSLEKLGVFIPKQFGPEVRQVYHDLIIADLESISTLQNLSHMVPAGESISKITGFLDDFLSSLIKFFDLQCTFLPQAILEANVQPSSEIEFRTKFIDALKMRPNFEISIVFISHWLNEDELIAWKLLFLKKLGSWRFNFWVRKYNASYGSIPDKLSRMISSVQEDQAATEHYLSPRGRKQQT